MELESPLRRSILVAERSAKEDRKLQVTWFPPLDGEDSHTLNEEVVVMR